MKLLQNFTKTCCLIAVSIILNSGCQTIKPIDLPDSADPRVEIEKTEKEIMSAKSNHVNVLSPNYFTKAKEGIDNAREMVQSNENKRSILEEIGESQAYLLKAKNVASIARQASPEVVQARDDAIKAKADTYAIDLLKKADDQLRNDTEEIESSNDVNSLQKSRQNLKNIYLSAELQAIKEMNLGETRKVLELAKQEEAMKFAPNTYEESINSLREAEAFIDSNRHDSMVSKVAKKAQFEAEHLLKITREAKQIGGPNAESAALAIEEKQSELKQSQTLVQKNLKQAEKAKKTMKSENSILRSEKEFNDKYIWSKTEFNDSEAEVLRDGNTLLIRLLGMSFKVGKATIDASDFSLLQKVQNVILHFSPAYVTIEGHTDSTGSANMNRNLSLKRAQAVHEYFTANVPSLDKKIQFAAPKGYGPDKPLRPNNSKTNRALNRRVDITIQPLSEVSRKSASM